jgi:DNA-binding NtrC family response regulator
MEIELLAPNRIKSVEVLDEYEKLVSLIDESATLKEVEQAYIMHILSRHDGNVKQTANILGLSIKGLYNKLHVYGYSKKEGGK